MKEIPSYADVLEAAERIKPFTNRTPVFKSKWYNHQAEAELFFKCENFQKVGAFKFRGACNAVFTLNDHEANRGIVTHSSGNHAQAVALAARTKGYQATIIMPKNAPSVKVRAVKEYGAKILFCEPTIEARKEMTYQFIEETNAHFIHPYNHPMVIAGQGTVAKEFLDEIPDLDIIIAPVGGGGLISGTCITAKQIKPSIRVIGCEPELADDAYRSLKEGTIQPVLRTDTIADGLRTSLGDVTFTIMKEYLDDLVTVSEKSITREMRSVWERMKIIIEPSSAVPLAACMDQKFEVKGKKIGVILTGGNVDLDKLPWI
tara:strand:+ start:30861 stop:31811 length:951 start_codon:yes stop_codon:yes gene_type:complete